MDQGLEEMVRTFAWSPREAFTSGGPSTDPLPWQGSGRSEDADRERAFTFSRFVLSVAARDYGFNVTGEIENACYVDGKYDRGLDGIAIAVGDEIITDAAKAHDIPSPNDKPIKLLFVQSKHSEYIDAKDVTDFGAAVQAFLLEVQYLKNIATNEPVTRLWHTYAAIRERCGESFCPDVTLAFGYRGDWRSMGYPNVRLARRQQRDNLRAQFPLARFAFDPMDSDELSKAALRAGIAIARTLPTLSLLELPHGTAATGFVAVVDARALLDAFSESSAKGLSNTLDDHLFLENPRFYLGEERESEWNVGAAALAETISENKQSTVLLCHNGINIVASGAWRDKVDDSKLVLVTPQVVNGCQSTYRMNALREKLNDVNVLVKIAVTRDGDLKDAIIRGSNTQEIVSDLDMLSRNRMIRELEKEFDRASPDSRMWLERRINERKLWAEEDPGWEFDSDRIVTPRDLMDAFNSTILGAPHDSHSRLAAVLGRVAERPSGAAVRIFSLETEPSAYLACAWILFAGRKWGKYKHTPWLDGPDDKENSGFWARHHFHYALFRIGDTVPDAISRADLKRGGAQQKRFEKLVGKLVDRDKRQELGRLAGDAVTAAEAKVRDFNKANPKGMIPLGLARMAGNAKFRELVRVEADKRRI